ncbi:MAG: restriction endonuclease subunit S [Limnohabitans sp.]|nr:restriction endonuclease subunit S [Limnohabitans sp.]
MISTENIMNTWFGDNRNNWKLLKLKYIVSKIDEVFKDETELKLAVENIQGFTGKLVDLDAYNYESELSKFIKDDILFNKLRPYLGKVYIAESIGGAFGELLILRIFNQDIIPRYLFYVMINKKFIDLVDSSTTGAKMPRASWEDFIKHISIPIPSIKQQNKIIAYLDKEVDKIDALIEKKAKLIALLEEKKKAVINQAVTKGLDTTVAMKDSGIEWLGEIPEHWEVVKLKYLSKNIDTGSTPNGYDIPIEELNENVWNWFTPGDFNEDFNFVNESKRKLSFEVVEDNNVRLYDTNSVMFVGIGATLGKIAVTDTNFYTNQQINIIELNNDINKMFVAYSLSATIKVSKMLANSATLPILNQQKLGDIQIPIPDLNEQILVVEHLENIYFNHFNIVNKISTSIELLKEKRTSIISAAINGEINLD